MSAPGRDPSEAFEEALANLEFAQARELADRQEGSRKDRMLERVTAERVEATDRAEKLAARIQFLARADHYEGLLALAEDPTTGALLALVSRELRRGATLHLDGALRRRKRFREAAERHMAAAAEALVTFDTARAISELDKVDKRWLTKAQREKLSKLRSQTDQAAAERKEIETRTAEVLREHAPHPSNGTPAARKRTPGGGRTRGSGCLGSLAIALAVLTLTLLALAR